MFAELLCGFPSKVYHGSSSLIFLTVGCFFFPSKVYIVSGGKARLGWSHSIFFSLWRRCHSCRTAFCSTCPVELKVKKKNWTGKRESALCVKWVFYFESPTNQSFIFHFQPGVMKESWDKAYAPWVCRPCTLYPRCPRTQPRRRLWPHLHARLQSGSRRGLCLVHPHTQKFWHGEKNV